MWIKYKPVLLDNFFGCENVEENTYYYLQQMEAI